MDFIKTSEKIVVLPLPPVLLELFKSDTENVDIGGF